MKSRWEGGRRIMSLREIFRERVRETESHSESYRPLETHTYTEGGPQLSTQRHSG